MTSRQPGVSRRPTGIADDLFAAFEAGNIAPLREICANDMAGCQNRGPSMTLDAQLEVCRLLDPLVDGVRPDEVRRLNTDPGLRFEHVVCGRLPDGTDLRIPACVLGKVSDGLIRRTGEYIDTGAARPLIEALGAVIFKQDVAR